MRGKIVRILALLAATGSVWASTTYTSSGGGFIFDNSSVSVDIVVSDTSLIQLVGDNLTVAITGLSGQLGSQPQALGDLIATLTFIPSVGPVVSQDLFNRPGVLNPGDTGYLASFNGNYTFDSSGASDLWATAAGLGATDVIPGDPNVYFTTTVGGALSNLSSAFNGIAVTGTWRLTMSDNFDDGGADEGSFLQWSFTVNTAQSTPEPPYRWIVGVLLAIGFPVVRARRRSASVRPHS
jgi:hypothetical protein